MFELLTSPQGKSIEYVLASDSSEFKIWKEVGGNRILRANGMDQWALELNLNGKGQSDNEFTGNTVIKGRACPTNVYMSDENKFSTGNCLYYTETYPQQDIQAAGTSQTNPATLGLAYWRDHTGGDSDSRWYVGNMKTCGDLGMRPPTMYETTTTDTANANYPVANDGTATFALDNGVPSAVAVWTSTSYSNQGNINNGWTNGYFTWNNTNDGWSWSSDPASVICVLP